MYEPQSRDFHTLPVGDREVLGNLRQNLDPPAALEGVTVSNSMAHLIGSQTEGDHARSLASRKNNSVSNTANINRELREI